MILPSQSRRHALREALMTVAPIYAVHADRHRLATEPRSFERQIFEKLIAEQRSKMETSASTSIRRLVADLVTTSSSSRNELLLRLVDAFVNGGPNRRPGLIDFADLLLEVARWNDPADPTPSRWRRLLQPAESVTFTR